MLQQASFFWDEYLRISIAQAVIKVFHMVIQNIVKDFHKTFQQKKTYSL